MDSLPVTSPCIGVCAIDDGSCLGCGRTLAEIEIWPQASFETRQAILKRIADENAQWSRQ